MRASECAPALRELADLWCRMDAHEGQAAWAGAIGTILAILASAVFALLIPILLRSQEDRRLAERSLRNIRVAASETLELWLMLGDSIEKENLTDTTIALLEARIAGIRALLTDLQRHMLDGDAAAVTGIVEMLLGTTITFASKALDGSPASASAVVSNQVAYLRDQGVNRSHGLVVSQHRGTWIVESRAARAARGRRWRVWRD